MPYGVEKLFTGFWDLITTNFVVGGMELSILEIELGLTIISLVLWFFLGDGDIYLDEEDMMRSKRRERVMKWRSGK